MQWHCNEAAEATGGTTQGQWVARRVSIDSRAIEPGDLFVAIKGERFDGHAYVKNALAQGAAAAVVSHIPEGVPPDAPLLIVADTQHALTDLGKYARMKTRAKVVGVTGSVGKTGTKEALALALSAAGPTYATKGNLNNHLGVPLSLANLPEDTQFAVFEMGMNHAGEIAALTRIVRPDIAVITAVEPAHLEYFGSVEAIADAKAEIFLGMSEAGGVAVLNRDNPHFNRLRTVAEQAGVARIVSFGTHAESDCWLVHCSCSELGSQIEAVISGTPVTYALGAIGQHWALASTAVLAVVEALGVDLAVAAAALSQFREPEGRGKLTQIPVAGGVVSLVDDSYNASPASMRAAFAKLRDIRNGSPAITRTVAVLGDMLELGPDAPKLHADLHLPIAEYGISTVYTAGPLMRHLHDALPVAQRGAHAATAATLTPFVWQSLRSGDLVLVKGSHGSRMGDVVKQMLMYKTEPQKVKDNAL